MRSEYNNLIDTATANSQLAYNAYAHICERTEAMCMDQIKLARKLEADYENLIIDKSGAELQNIFRDFVYREREYFQLFDISKKHLNLPYQVKCNKMDFILTKVYNQITSDTDATSFIKLAEDKLAYEDSFQQFPILRTDTYWGSNRGTIESAKMLCMRFAFSPETIFDYAQSSIAHVTQCTSLTLPIVKDTISKFFVPLNQSSGFGFVHGGYAFGGQRGERAQVKFGPEDCSSMVANLLEQTVNDSIYPPARNQFTTVDLLHAWNGQKQLPNLERTDNIKAGDIFLSRTENGGHTGIVIGRDPDKLSRVLIFECARDMETGFGNAGAGVGSHRIEPMKVNGDKTTGTMFLRLPQLKPR